MITLLTARPGPLVISKLQLVPDALTWYLQGAGTLQYRAQGTQDSRFCQVQLIYEEPVAVTGTAQQRALVKLESTITNGKIAANVILQEAKQVK